MKLHILGFVDDSHSATAEFFDDAVVRDSLVDQGATPWLCGTPRQVNES